MRLGFSKDWLETVEGKTLASQRFDVRGADRFIRFRGGGIKLAEHSLHLTFGFHLVREGTALTLTHLEKGDLEDGICRGC